MHLAEIKVSYNNPNPEKIKVTCSQVIYDLMLRQWDLNNIEYKEEAKLLLLNTANIVLGVFELSKGGISGTVVDIRIILGVALKSNASAIILIHNHPSGNIQPSNPDLIITNKLKQACDLLELKLLDHLIISKEGYYSFTDSGIL
jgi:DNA repair protein RadC